MPIEDDRSSAGNVADGPSDPIEGNTLNNGHAGEVDDDVDARSHLCQSSMRICSVLSPREPRALVLGSLSPAGLGPLVLGCWRRPDGPVGELHAPDPHLDALRVRDA
jgi:hypothetical protein